MSLSSILPLSFGGKRSGATPAAFRIAERVIVDVLQPLEPALDGLQAADSN